MTKRERKYATIGALIFAAVAAACIAWYVALPGDQLILLGMLVYPAAYIFGLLSLLSVEPWPIAAQATALVLLGLLQWGIVGFGIASLVDEPGSTKDD